MAPIRPTLIISALAEARSALAAARAAGIPVRLVSGPAEALATGVPYFREMAAMLSAEFTDVDWRFVLDCGPYPGLALSAIRFGIRRLMVAGDAELRDRISHIALKAGAVIEAADGPVLDLRDLADPLQSCQTWLSGLKKPC